MEARQGARRVAEVHLVDVAAGTELADGGGNVLALAVGAGHLREGADAEQDARMGVAAGDADGLAERIGAAGDPVVLVTGTRPTCRTLNLEPTTRT